VKSERGRIYAARPLRTRARFKLTPLGRNVLAALLKPPVDDQDE
jgi:hypothetical protein